MKKVLSGIIFAIIMTVCFFGGGCGEDSDKNVSVEPNTGQSEVLTDSGANEISLGAKGMKTDFYLNDEFSAGNITVWVDYEDGTKKDLNSGEYTIDSSEFDSTKEGEYSITVRKGSLNFTYKATVEKKKWSGDVRLPLDD